MQDYLMQFFKYSHLPEHLQEISRPFCNLAEVILTTLPENPERTVALRKLLESKDCAVRAALFNKWLLIEISELCGMKELIATLSFIAQNNPTTEHTKGRVEAYTEIAKFLDLQMYNIFSAQEWRKPMAIFQEKKS